MSDSRILFRKEGRAVYISHLDLVRTLQRAFLRAGLSIRHAGAYNPHAFISVAVPLSVGYSSQCELLDVGLPEDTDLTALPEKLNRFLPEGLSAVTCYQSDKPVKQIGKLLWRLELLYDNGVPAQAEDVISALFSQPELVMQKKSKKAKSGFTQVDLIPLIGAYQMTRQTDKLVLEIQMAAQNPGLNPALLVQAIAQADEALTPDFLRARRLEVYDIWGERFDGAFRPENGAE